MTKEGGGYRLRAEPATADAWAREKARCAALHPDDSAAYAACKKAWTDGVAAEAVRGGEVARARRNRLYDQSA